MSGPPKPQRAPPTSAPVETAVLPGNTGDGAAGVFLDLIPDLNERSGTFRVSNEFVDEAVLAAFERQMASIRTALHGAVEAADKAAVRRHAHSLQGMGGRRARRKFPSSARS